LASGPTSPQKEGAAKPCRKRGFFFSGEKGQEEGRPNFLPPLLEVLGKSSSRGRRGRKWLYADFRVCPGGMDGGKQFGKGDLLR